MNVDRFVIFMDNFAPHKSGNKKLRKLLGRKTPIVFNIPHNPTINQIENVFSKIKAKNLNLVEKKKTTKKSGTTGLPA